MGVAKTRKAEREVRIGDQKQRVLSLLTPGQKLIWDEAKRPSKSIAIDGSQYEIIYFRTKFIPDDENLDEEFTPYIFKDEVLIAKGATSEQEFLNRERASNDRVELEAFNSVAAKSDFVDKPSDDVLLQRLQAWAESNLKDPYSAKFEITRSAAKGWGEPFGSSDRYIGWRFKAYVNAKNTFGGYTGAQEHEFILVDNKVIMLSYAGNVKGTTIIVTGKNGYL